MLALRRRRNRQPESLQGLVVVITGGSRGLGLVMAREYAKRGCRLVICARDEVELERAREDLLRRGAEVLAIPCDVGARDDVLRVVAAAIEGYGRIDILVNNAGIILVAPIENLDLDDYEHAMRTMYWGMVYPTLAVLPSMRIRGDGRIVNVTSIGGKVSIPHLSPYSSAKFAAVGFSEGLRAELAGTGVSVTTVVPGLMRTGSHLNALFGGRAPQEATWFSLVASLPGITISAEHAARAVADASLRRRPMAVLGLPARGATWLHGLFPGLTARLLGLVNRAVLPDPAEGNLHRLHSGRAAAAQSSFPMLDWLTSMGTAAADRNNQHPGPDPSLRPPDFVTSTGGPSEGHRPLA
jgi:short-subunit dehydrogenase